MTIETPKEFNKLLKRLGNKKNKEHERLKKENEQLKQAIAFSRQYYHLPQEVYDVFRCLVDESYDKKIKRKPFLNSLEGLELTPYGEE